MTSLNTGGIATSLLNLLNELKSRNDLNIDVVLFHRSPNDEILIPEGIAIKYPGKMTELIAISVQDAKKMGIKYYVLKYILGAICKLFGHGIAYKIIFRFCQHYDNYDYAISCSQSAPIHSMYGGCNEFVLHNIVAKKKISFIHCDYVTYGLNDKYSHKVYAMFDKIAVVSNSVGRVFLGVEPEFVNKTFTVRNCHNINKILTSSENETVAYDSNDLNILTVARMGDEKGHMRVLDGLRRLKDVGIRCKWHIVGGCIETAPAEFIKKIKEYDVESNVVFYGIQSNPYRYMPKADFLLVPSLHEAAPMVFDEARLLHLPVVTTNTVSAEEMVGSYEVGLVCDNTDTALSDALIHVAKNPELLKTYRENTYKIVTDNSLAITQFMNIIGD